MHFAVICWDAAGSAERRRASLEAHRGYVDAHADVLVVSGALLADEGGARIGQLFVLDVADREAAEAFVAADPLSLSGVFGDVVITPMAVKFLAGERLG